MNMHCMMETKWKKWEIICMKMSKHIINRFPSRLPHLSPPCQPHPCGRTEFRLTDTLWIPWKPAANARLRHPARRHKHCKAQRLPSTRGGIPSTVIIHDKRLLSCSVHSVISDGRSWDQSLLLSLRPRLWQRRTLHAQSALGDSLQPVFFFFFLLLVLCWSTVMDAALLHLEAGWTRSTVC